MSEMNTPNEKGKTIRDYLPLAARSLGLAQRPKEEMTPVQELPEKAMEPIIDKMAIEKAIATLKRYKDGKRSLETRIVEEERWWKLRHWDVIRGRSGENRGEEARPEPTSAWLFNSIANKHADIMDNYPEPSVLPRERSDEQNADTLSAILPVVFERNEYERTYSRAAWYKLKHGVAAKGVFWNQDCEDGLGDVDVRFIDMLNIFWEPGITDLQTSRNLFIVSLKDNELLQAEYPQLRHKTGGQLIDVQQYVHDDNVDVTDKSLVVDWYYKKKTPEGRTLLHLVKFVGSEILFSSEDARDAYGEKEYPNGFYEHGRYPVEFDVLFPEEGTPIGFGYIAVMKSPQLIIDKLSQVILENSMMSAKPRFFAKKGLSVNEEEFLDWSKPIVHYEGDINNIQPLAVQQVGGNVLNVLQMKIDELKQTSSNRDVSQGSSSGGVTAAAAIAALQEAGNKTSRDMIAAAYRSYTNECYLAIELIRQFYDEQRTFRITGERGQNEYIPFSNADLRPQIIPPAYPGQELESDYVPASRKPIFDVVAKPQKRSPYSKMAQNELAKELYRLGFFNPQLADQSLAALELMDFDGQEKVRDRVQQGQMLMDQVVTLRRELQKMGRILSHHTAQDTPSVPQSTAPRGAGMGKAQKNAQLAAMSDYGRTIAARAKKGVQL